MKKTLNIPEIMTGKQIAELLSKVRRLKWRRWGLGSDPRNGYCALGQIARLAGVSNETLAEVDCDGGIYTNVGGAYVACRPVTAVNDQNLSKEGMLKGLCALGEHKVPVGKFVAKLQAHDRAKGRSK
jgi:hypothetical protein